MNKIYKYVRFEDALKIVSNNSVKLNNPSNFNDPFDSAVEIEKNDEQKSFNLILEFYLFYSLLGLLYNKNIKYSFLNKIQIAIYRLMYKFYIWIIIKQGFYSNPMLKIIIKVLFNRLSTEQKKILKEKESEFVDSVSSLIKDINRSIYVSCFSKRNDSILMWSHYADKHKGVCLEFERPNNDFYDVKYKNKRKSFNLYSITSIVLGYVLKSYLNGNSKIDYQSIASKDKTVIKRIMNPYLIKSLNWKYEVEVRCIFSGNEDNDNIIKINDELILYIMPNKVSKVYLGCNIDPKNEKLIREELSRINIPVYKFKTSNNEFKLDFI